MMNSQVTAVVLAGGASSRMGQNKLWFPFGDHPVVVGIIHKLTSLFHEVVVVTDEPRRYEHLSVRITTDLIACAKKNSLVGIHAGLSVIKSPFAFVMGGDMPFIQLTLVDYLVAEAIEQNADITLPWAESHPQPLCSIYSTQCLPLVEQLIVAGNYRVKSLLSLCRTHNVLESTVREYDPHLKSFFNLNTPEDYQRALCMLKGELLK